MKKHLSIIALCYSLLPFLPATAQTAAPKAPTTIAVLSFDATDEKLKAKGSDFSTLLAAHLSTKPELWLLERAEIEKIADEHTLKLSGLTDPAQTIATGKIIGASVLVTGRIIATGSNYILVAKVISTETSRVFGETISATSLDSADKPCADLATKLDELIRKQYNAFHIVYRTREDRLATLRTALAGKKLPSVEIRIDERDLSQRSIDPAAQTEFQKMCQELGFEVIDSNSSGKSADLVIQGEGISQTGSRFGELTSARARIEIKVTRKNDSKLLIIDRETGTAVDPAPTVAGKTALQDTAFTLAERVLPKLIQP